ncbi:MAG: XamI family restriction endonuclease [Candidatus Kryptoniota bacterium]
MAVNSNKPDRWKSDIAQSVDFYNKWFMRFAPKAHKTTRVMTTKQVESALKLTKNLTDIAPSVLKNNPSVLPILRMATAPPIARDRLIGLADISSNLVMNMEEEKRIRPRMKAAQLESELRKISKVIRLLADDDIFPWLDSKKTPTNAETYRASTIVADRLCGAVADPIIRNAQEKRQLASIKRWLEKRGYKHLDSGHDHDINKFPPATFSFRFNVSVNQAGNGRQVNIPIDVIIMPKEPKAGRLPLMIEAKSAGDFTNTNKRRKEEATKINQLRSTYGKEINFILFLCGYFDSGYLGYEAAEGIDWVWEYRINDLEKFDL